MSRFIEILNDHRGEVTMRTLPACLKDIKTRLSAESAHLVHFNVINGSFGFWYMPRIMKVFTITALLPRLNGLVQLLHNQHPHWRRQHMHEKNWSYSGISFTRCV
jgi:hypothetical protein